MFAIFKKEFKNYFATSNIFYIFFICFLLQIISMPNKGIMWFNSMRTFLAVSIIGFGMGLISQELKNKTYKLLFCSPVKKHSIILGKYFALTSCFVIASFLAILITLIVRFCFGATLTLPEIIFGFLGLTALTMFFSAIVVFVSTWSSSVGVLCAICYVGYTMMSLGDGYMSSIGINNIWVKIYSIFFQYTKPYFKLMFGIIGIDTVIYFTSMIVGLLFLANKFLDSKRFV